jgi:predicted 3-demethylubiquinone-9 3-methyltransferase (glyoxalase superfamily)
MAKNTICLWYDKDAEAAARFYAEIFPDSAVGGVHRAPSDYPSGKEGDVLTVEFTVAGVPCIGLNGGSAFKHNEAFSFQIATDDQQETDRYWNAIVGNGGQESACGWCKDRWGVSWQITPRVLTEALAAGGDQAKRAFDAMMGMKKIDVAAIKAARLTGEQIDHRAGHIAGEIAGAARLDRTLALDYVVDDVRPTTAKRIREGLRCASCTGSEIGADIGARPAIYPGCFWRGLDRQIACQGSCGKQERRAHQ